ncbi:hypothetical protein PRZ48_000998 [Zasmidium cellare]|uniref:Uncharacterized protein n=1 Tax=Zasmidium cellare TaxID=395010 RepID=A0ABR0F2F5_ZASCE|nr:hypothetical protein PRZ48_000998 [Zasmidium cellare]
MSSTTFDCVACMETFSTQPIAVLNHRMCLNCCQAGIVSQFHAALRDPTSYPVKYAGQELDIDNFTQFFDAQFLRDWAAKKDEYDTPIAERIYCAGGTCGAEQPPPRDAPPELEARYADRLILRRIAREALDALEGDLGDDTAWMSRVSLLASGLLSSIEAYALHLNPDPEARLDGLAIVEMLHPYIQSWYGTAGDEGHNRFPALRPIYERYVRARGEQLRERGLGDGH